MGGIYRAALSPDPALVAVVLIGQQVPGEKLGTGFTRIGEALSFDGRWVAFWAAWGSETWQKTLLCPTDGNADIVEACNEQHPDGFVVDVPVSQGFFVADAWSGEVHAVAKAGEGLDDLVYWNFSGSPPGAGGGDEGGDQEPPRWRSASFIAVAGVGPGTFQTVFKGRSSDQDLLFRAVGPGGVVESFVGTGTPGTEVDPQAPAGSSIVSIGIERDGLRGGALAMTASMLDEVTGESWAGIYVTAMPTTAPCTGDLDGDGMVSSIDLAALLGQWGCSGACSADLDGDGAVTGADLGIMLALWGPCDSAGLR